MLQTLTLLLPMVGLLLVLKLQLPQLLETVDREANSQMKEDPVCAIIYLLRTSAAQCETYNTHTKILKYTVTKSIPNRLPNVLS